MEFTFLYALFTGSVRLINLFFLSAWQQIWHDWVFRYFLIVGLFSLFNLLLIRWTNHLEKLPKQHWSLALLCFLLWPSSTFSVIVESNEQPEMPPCASLLYMRPWWYIILMPVGIWIKLAWNLFIIAIYLLVSAFMFLAVLEEEVTRADSFTNRNRRTRELACHL